MKKLITILVSIALWSAHASAQESTPPTGDASAEAKPFSAEELEQLVAPIALYPDSVISQVLMAASYPLDVVSADRWIKGQKPPLEGDALAKALEKQTWDPSVKSLINFPAVLGHMSEKLDWTVKLGDAVLASEKDVLDATQRLRKRAKEAGNLETGEEQTVTAEGEVIVIEPTNTEVIYIPTYNPTVVYGTWPYPTYPPTYYYPPHYVYPPTPCAFVTGVAIGLAWGYAWGGCGWHSGHVDIDINRNINVNNNINRNKYKTGTGGKGNWKHNPSNRKGVRYRDNKTANRYGKQAGPSSRNKSSQAYRGRSTANNRASTTGNRSTARTPSTTNRRTTPKASTQRSSRSNSAFKNSQSRSRTTSQSNRGRSSRSRARSGGGRRGGGRRGR